MLADDENLHRMKAVISTPTGQVLIPSFQSMQGFVLHAGTLVVICSSTKFSGITFWILINYRICHLHLSWPMAWWLILWLFWRKRTCHCPDLKKILEFLGASVNTLSDQQLTSKMKMLLTTFKSLSKRIHWHNWQVNMNGFLSSTPVAAPKVPVFPPTEKDHSVASAEMTTGRGWKKSYTREGKELHS